MQNENDPLKVVEEMKAEGQRFVDAGQVRHVVTGHIGTVQRYFFARWHNESLMLCLEVKTDQPVLNCDRVTRWTPA